MPHRALARLLLSALTAFGVVVAAQQLVAPAVAGAAAPTPQVALSTGPTHEDPLPGGLDWDDPVDTTSLYRRAGLDRAELVRRTRDGRTATDATAGRVAAAVIPPGEPSTPGLTAHVAPSCTGDGVDGKRVQAMYVREATTPSRYGVVLPLLQNEVANVDDVFAVSAQKTGGVRRVRWVHSGCVPVIPEVVVPAGALASFSATKEALSGLGYNDPNRKYLAFADASVLCGIGTFYPDSRPVGNPNDGYKASYSRVDSRCWSPGSISVAAHELTHNLGGVLPGAPHVTPDGHCWDENDVMCYVDGGGVTMQTVCADKSHERLLDCNGDDYFNTAPAPGSWLSQSWNTASSGFLDTSAPSVAPPPVTTPPPAGKTTVAPQATKLRADWKGRIRKVVGDLRRADGSRVAGAKVELQRKYAGSSRWVTVDMDTTDRSGAVASKERPRRTAYFRWVYKGSSTLEASRSDRVRARR